MKSKIDIVIEWILNDMELLNKEAKQKLEDKLIGRLKYYKDSYGNTLRIEVCCKEEESPFEDLLFKIDVPGLFQSFGGINSNIHNTEERMENMFLKRIDELDQKLELILKKLDIKW